MEDDQFHNFVQLARSYLSNPGLFMDSTAAEGRARGYLMVDLPRDGGDDFLSRLIDESVEDKSSWDALSLIAQELMRESEPLPHKLAKWAVDVLADQCAKRGDEKRPRPGSGGDARAGRDWNIYFLIDRLRTKWNINPTRNETSDPVSGCDIVAKASSLPYGTIARVWNERSHQMCKA